MSANILSLIAGVVLSLFFSYIPGLKDWFEKQSTQSKQLIMAACLIVSAGAIFGLSCAGWLADLAPGWVVACDKAGGLGLVQLLIYALISNQSTYLITRK